MWMIVTMKLYKIVFIWKNTLQIRWASKLTSDWYSNFSSLSCSTCKL